MRIVLGILCAALSLPGTRRLSRPADSYPNKPIRIIVPFAPGGIVDTSARVIGQKLSKRWGQQVVVENRPGGNGFIGVMADGQSAGRRLHAADGAYRRVRRSIRRYSRTCPSTSIATSRRSP